MKLILFLPLVVFLATDAAAQDSTAAPVSHPEPGECYRFAFGPWSSPLDWKTAGHRVAGTETPADVRGDASRIGAEKLGDIVVYPSWWPVGVYINLDTARAHGDTVRGIATALVADGQANVPTAKVIAFHVPCSGRPVQSQAPTVDAQHKTPLSPSSRVRPRRTRRPSTSP